MYRTMLRDKEIIVFSDELGRHPFSCQHIMEHFFDANRIVWVTPTGMRNPNLSLYDLKRAFEKLRKWTSPEEKQAITESGGPIRLGPAALPYNDNSLVRIINNRIVTKKVRQQLTPGKQRIVITTLPITAEYVDLFEADAIIYYIVDDFIEWPGINREYMLHLEEMLIGKSDLLFASARKLCDIKTRKTVPLLLPHGVDFQHFYPGLAPSKEPDLYPGIKHPIIGFFGAVSPWLDFELLVAAARAHQEWSFVFLGPVDADVGELRDLDNVFFPGKVPYADLPRYAWQFDVGIIPFLVNELTLSVNPLKLLEYLACGLPVVSTALPEVEKFRENVHLADTTAEFIHGLELAVAEGNTGREVRQRLAEENSWRSVAERFSHEIETFLGAK